MTPQEKAETLLWKFYHADGPNLNFQLAKECAIICVEQIIEAAKQFDIDLDKYHGQQMFPEIEWEHVFECLKNS